MKKMMFLVLSLAAFTGASAQNYNLFPTSDGWLMFNTQETIDSYVGVINETDYKVETGSGAKMVQTVYADQMPDYPPTEASPNFVGIGTDGEKGTAGSVNGALMLQPASASMSTNGGGFIVCLPSCSTYSIDYSCESRVMCRILATTNANADMSKASSDYALDSSTGWKVITAKYSSVFSRLPSGHNTYSDIETYDNGFDDVTIKSDKPIYVWFQSLTKDTIYIHGIKVTTPKQETNGIKAVTAAKGTTKAVYTIDGKYLGNSVATVREKGLYIVKEGDDVRKVTVK